MKQNEVQINNKYCILQQHILSINNCTNFTKIKTKTMKKCSNKDYS